MGKKAKIKVRVETWSGYDLDGDLVDVIAKLQKVMVDNPELFDFKIECETESGYYGSCSTEITIDAHRWETDKEFVDRILAQNSKKAQDKLDAIRKAEAQEKREKSLYESLKRKFEKEIDETTPN